MVVHLPSIQPDLGGSVRSKGQPELRGCWAHQACVHPGTQVVAGIVEGCQVDEVIVLTAHVLPPQLRTVELERCAF